MVIVRLLARLFALKIAIRAVRDPDYEPRALEAHREVQGTTSLNPERPVPTQKAGQPGPDTPLELAASDWKATAKRALNEIKDDRVTLIAAGMAYYFFLAIFPALIAVIGVFGLLDIEPEGLKESVKATLPAGAGTALVQGIDRANNQPDDASLVAAVVGIALAVWSASSGMVALQRGLNVAYDVASDRKFVKARAIALLLVVATLLLGGVPSPFFTFEGSWVLDVLGWTLTILAVVILFSLFYFLGPNREAPTWHWVTPGGVVGALIWIVGSTLFFLYANMGSYSKTYGPLSGVIVLVFWLFITSVSVLIGGELNAEIERQSAKKQETA